MEEAPIKGKDERKAKRRKLRKVLRKVKDDFSVRAEKYETYQETVEGRNSFSKTNPDATFMRMKDDHMGSNQATTYKSPPKTSSCYTMIFIPTQRIPERYYLS